MAVLQNELLCYFRGAASSIFCIFCQKQVLSLLCWAGRCAHGAVLLGGRSPVRTRSREHRNLGMGSAYVALFKTASYKFFPCICQLPGCTQRLRQAVLVAATKANISRFQPAPSLYFSCWVATGCCPVLPATCSRLGSVAGSLGCELRRAEVSSLPSSPGRGLGSGTALRSWGWG